MAAGRRSPFKTNPRTLRDNQLATPKYTMEKNSNSPVPFNDYVHKIKSATNLAVWNAIADDQNVKSALTVLATIGYSNSKKFYHAASYLLNCISHAYLLATADPVEPTDAGSAQAAQAASTSTPASAIVFSTECAKIVRGDYLGAQVKPDLNVFVADMAKLATALAASADAPFSELVDFSRNLSFGEWKLKAGGLGQLLWYLSALKRCRPDLRTVHGVFLDASKRLMLISVNACGSCSSDPVTLGFEEVVDGDAPKGCPPKITIPSTDTWIAYVVLLYKTHLERNANFSLDQRADDIVMWNVQLPRVQPITVRPFHATHCPGRMTWASFVLDIPDSDQSPPASASQSPLAKGFLKTSWQDSSSSFTETSMLEVAHQDGWLPGLVRHWTAFVDPSSRLTLHEGVSRPARLQEFVYLASLGQPLSQCESALHLLKVIYDATETHLQLLVGDVLHGDMSWFNILCNPWHDENTLDVKPVVPDIPCIDYILTGDDKKQPCALVLDLDHAAQMTSLYSDTHRGGREKTGTPMFVSVELSSKDPVQCGSSLALAEIADRLALLDSEKYTVLKERAFPEGDDDFMKNLRKVVEKEAERKARGEGPPWTNPHSRHRPHHDVESIYWVLVWAFSRACPLGESPHGTLSDAFSQFADIMLEHRLGHDAGRSKYLRGEGIEPAVFHPFIRKNIFPALETLAAYLAVPWHLYVHIVHPSHAHVALRRALLPLIYDIEKNHIPNVFFNTAQPRTMLLPRSDQDRKAPTGPGTPSITASSDRRISRNVSRTKSYTESPLAQQSPSSSSESSSLSSVPPSSSPAAQPLPPPIAQPESISSGPPADTGDARPRRRRPNAMDRLAILRVHDEYVVGAKRAADDEEPEEEESPAKRAKTDDNDTDRTVLDVETLVKMFWADRKLWFGSGFQSAAERNAVMAAALKGQPL